MLTKNLRICGYKVPLYPLFMVSGALCDICQAFIDYLISLVYTLEWGKTTVCWTLSYTLSIVLRHTSHRLLVFGDYEGTYCMSLARTYMAYSSAIVISMFANHQMVALFGLSHRNAWILTMLFTGVYNFFVLKASWRVINKASGIEIPVNAIKRDRTISLAENGVHSGNRERTSSGGNNFAVKKKESDSDSNPTPPHGNRRRSSSMRVDGDIAILSDSNMKELSSSVRHKEKDSSLDLVHALKV
jgi:hypothetical protein